MYKNLTLKQITFYIAVVVSLTGSVTILGLYLGSAIATRWWILVLIIICQFVFSYIIVSKLLERFIFRKIKLIYKLIYESKLGPNSAAKAIEFNETSIEEVNQEVQKWKETKESEIQSLKTLEDYRKSYVGNISHELKTPIFSIQGYLHTLLDGGIYDNNINLKYLERAAANAERLQNIVEDLEIISKLESGKLTLELQDFDIKHLIEEIFNDLQVMAAERNIKLTFKDNADSGFLVHADREAIRQVVNNLVINSIKYGKEGGVTKVSMYDVEENILVEVSDNGLGIDETHIKHVFDRFYRIDTSRSRAQGGSGLGLSIVKHIIDAHNQTINLRSTHGVGSTFGFTLKKA